MNQLSSITPLEIILIGSAAVGVFLFFRACWRNIKRSRQHLGVALITLVMTLTAQTAWADTVYEKEVSSWAELKSVSIVNGSKVTLTKCIKTTAKLTISETVTLDLNGYGIRSTASRGDFIMIDNGGNLTLKDNAAVKPTRFITIDDFYGSAVSTSVPSGKYITVNGGYITGARSSAVANYGTFTMAGGTLCGNGTAGIYANSITTLAGGTITGNHEHGVYIYGANAVLKMTGGSITGNNIFINGGGVYVDSGKFIMAGGSITGNTISGSTNGGGVYVENGTCIIAGGTVSGNTAGSGNGNNIYSKKSTDVYIFPGCVDGGIGQSSSTYAPKQSIFGTDTDGSDAKPFVISDAAGWNVFCELINNDIYRDKHYELGDDISVTRMAGSGSKPFTGTFNGQGNTLTVNFSATTHYCAPFCYVSGSNASVMIKNLHIAGAIITNTYMYGAGIVGKVMDNGNVTIDNCRSSVVIQSDYSGNGRHSGFVSRGDADATISIKGCVFDGSINAANSGQCAGFLASKQNSSVNVTIENCLFAPTVITIAGNDNKTFARGNNNSITNCYYTQALSTDQGTLPRTVTAGDEYVTVAAVNPVGCATATYTTSGITAYAKGIKRNGTFYYGNGDDVSLTLSHSNRTGYFFSGYSPNKGTLNGTTLTMPDANVTISANWADPNDFSVNAAGTEYTIKSAKGWDAFCYLLDDNTKGYFTSKTVKLAPSSGNSISVTRMAGSSSHKFTGTFDGDGKTLTVSYGTEAAPVSEEYAAPFRFVDGATIQNLHVEGSIISTVRRAAGVIGETGDNTSHITNCVSSSTISGGNFTGGFSIGGNVEIDGCVYNGKINGSGNSGGFVGYSNSALTISNSLFAPQSGSSISGGTFYYNGGGNITPVNSYYTQKLGTAQGKQAYEVSAAPELLGEGSGEGIVKTYENYGLGFDKKYYLATIPLSETEGVIYLTDYLQGKEVPVEFNREFSAGKASTICLPFAMDNVSGGKVYSFAGITYDEKDGWVATMSETETDGNNVTSTKANTPYVFMPDADGEVTFSGTTEKIPAAYDAKELSTVSGDWTFRGTYEQLKYGSNLDGHVYGFASRDKEVDGVNVAAGEFVKAKDGAGVKPMRCYLTYKDNQEFVGARAVTRGIEENLPQSITVKFVSSTGNTTAIATLNTQTGEITTDDAWYTLSGTRLPGKPTRRGIYINKGNKVVIR